MVRYGGFEAFLGRQSCKILGGQTLTLSLRRRHQLHWHQRDYLDVHQNFCFDFLNVVPSLHRADQSIILSIFKISFKMWLETICALTLGHCTL